MQHLIFQDCHTQLSRKMIRGMSSFSLVLLLILVLMLRVHTLLSIICHYYLAYRGLVRHLNAKSCTASNVFQFHCIILFKVHRNYVQQQCLSQSEPIFLASSHPSSQESTISHLIHHFAFVSSPQSAKYLHYILPIFRGGLVVNKPLTNPPLSFSHTKCTLPSV